MHLQVQLLLRQLRDVVPNWDIAIVRWGLKDDFITSTDTPYGLYIHGIIRTVVFPSPLTSLPAHVATTWRTMFMPLRNCGEVSAVDAACTSAMQLVLNDMQSHSLQMLDFISRLSSNVRRPPGVSAVIHLSRVNPEPFSSLLRFLRYRLASLDDVTFTSTSISPYLAPRHSYTPTSEYYTAWSLRGY